MASVEGAYPKNNGDDFYASESNALGYLELEAAESMSSGDACYHDTSDGKIYKSDDATHNKRRVSGFIIENVTLGNDAKFIKDGTIAISGLTKGTMYYLGNSGAISSTRSAVQVGIARSTGALCIMIKQDDEAIVGTTRFVDKSLTGHPANYLSAFWVELTGQTLSDAESPYDGQTLVDMQGTQRFIRSGTTSGTTAGSDTHSHSISLASMNKGDGGSGAYNVCQTSSTGSSSTIPESVERVVIQKIK